MSACLTSDFNQAERAQRQRERALEVDVGAGADMGAAGSDASDDGHAGAAGASGQAGGSGESEVSAGGAAAVGGGSAAGRGPGGAAGSKGSGGEKPADPASCGDTSHDPANCGECGHDCSAGSALASCSDGECMRACLSGFADCNGDLAFGSSGDGCETSVQSDLKNCGGCNVSCEPFWGTVAVCENRRCSELQLAVGRSAAVGAEPHGGTDGGDAFEQLCGRNGALVGMDVATSADALYGLGVTCAEELLNGKPGMLSTVWGERTTQALAGNKTSPPGTVMHVECPSGAVVTSVSGSTWLFGMNQVIRNLVLTCSQLWFDDKDQLQWSAGGLLRVGVQADDVIDTFTDTCPAGQVAVGFSGRSGWVVDALSTSCAPITLNRSSGASASDAAP